MSSALLYQYITVGTTLVATFHITLRWFNPTEPLRTSIELVFQREN